MSISHRGAGIINDRPAPPKWTFTREEMRLGANHKAGLSFEDELSYRQQAACFIQEMGDKLNYNVKDNRMKITQLGMCVANVHMHRFFYFHSFKTFDFRDVAAACLFLAGKTEESPRKLSHITQVWWEKKGQKLNETNRGEASQLLVYLESLVLQTISFDLNVDLPHSYVIHIMTKFDNSNNDIRKKIKTCAYYFATDVLCVMDWAIRYSPKAIAVAVVHLVSIFSDFKMENMFNDRKWYVQFDSEMTDEKLKEMEEEFMRVYNSCSHLHYASKIAFRDSTSPMPYKRMDPNKDRLPRQNYAPDYSKRSEENSRRYDDQRRQRQKDEHIQMERMERERNQEDERRKRAYDQMAGKYDTASIHEKRSRIDPLSSNFVTSHNNRANHSMTATAASNLMKQQPYANLKKVEKPLSPVVLQHRLEMSTLTPPPIPPPLSHSSSDMDLEDGELE